VRPRPTIVISGMLLLLLLLLCAAAPHTASCILVRPLPTIVISGMLLLLLLLCAAAAPHTASCILDEIYMRVVSPTAVFNIDMKEGEPMARPLAELVEEMGVQARVKVATTRTDGAGVETFRALQPEVTMVGTVGETINFALLWLIGLPDSVRT
jgi:hypothetical protein